MLNSCGKPSGDPQQDAEAFEGLIMDQLEINLEGQQKTADLAEYYLENENAKAYKKLQKEAMEMAEDLYKDYEDQIEDLSKHLEKVEKKIYKKKNKSDDDEEDEE